MTIRRDPTDSRGELAAATRPAAFIIPIPASNVAMATDGERTGLEWMDTAFKWLTSKGNSARLLAVICGGYALWYLALNIDIYAEGPPDLSSPYMPLYRHGAAFSWLDRNPVSGFLLSILILIPSISGMVLVWLWPRTGFLVAAAGWAVTSVVPLVQFYSGMWNEFPWGWKIIAFIVLPIVWHAVAAFTVKPVPSAAQAGLLD